MKPGSQLESFLKKCLSVGLAARASSVGELVASGFISGAAATQFVRTAGGKMDQLNNKLDALTEDVGYVKRNIDSVVRSLADIEQGVEAVRKTVINLDKSSIPMIFIIELPPETDNTADQMKRGKRLWSRILLGAELPESFSFSSKIHK